MMIKTLVAVLCAAAVSSLVTLDDTVELRLSDNSLDIEGTLASASFGIQAQLDNEHLVINGHILTPGVHELMLIGDYKEFVLTSLGHRTPHKTRSHVRVGVTCRVMDMVGGKLRATMQLMSFDGNPRSLRYATSIVITVDSAGREVDRAVSIIKSMRIKENSGTQPEVHLSSSDEGGFSSEDVRHIFTGEVWARAKQYWDTASPAGKASIVASAAGSMAILLGLLHQCCSQRQKHKQPRRVVVVTSNMAKLQPTLGFVSDKPYITA